MHNNIKYKDISIYTFLFITSFSVNFYVSSYGVYPVDTFIHYDTGYRILLGDVPIKDYWIVHGFLIDYIQAFFFKIFGNNWHSYLIHSSLMNVAVTIFSYYTFRILEVSKPCSFLSSLALSFLAYPVSGTPFLDLHSTYFSLIAIYFAILGVAEKKNYLWFWTAFFLSIAFFSKQVPAAYTIIVVSVLNFYISYTNKNKNIFLYYVCGAIIFLLFLLFFLTIQKIPLYDFILQIFLFPESIGSSRYEKYVLTIKNVVLDYKFIYLNFLIIVIINILNLKKNNFYYKSEKFQIFLIITSFTCSTIFHQIYTKNQIYIFFLIPFLLGFIFFFIKDIKFNQKTFFTYFLLLICTLVTFKYNKRFNIERQFHELVNSDLNNSVKIEIFDKKFKTLNWISPYYKNPNEELKRIEDLYLYLKEDKMNKMLITEYNFFSSLLEEKLYSPSRTYDDISYPKNNNKYYNYYKNFLLKKIKINKIKNIYIFDSKKIDEKRLDHLLFNYISKNCFKKNNFDLYIKKLQIIKCKDLEIKIE